MMASTEPTRVIYKYPLLASATEVPFGSTDRVLTVATQHGIPCLWVEHRWPVTDRTVVFRGVGTGGSPNPNDVYVGTAHDVEGMGMVFHIYREGTETVSLAGGIR